MRELRLRNLLSLAEGHMHGGRFLRAVAIYSRALEISQPGEFEHEFCHARLGDLRVGMGNFQAALPHLRMIRALNETEPLYALMLGRVLLELGVYEEAGAHLMDALISPFYATEAYSELSRVAEKLGEPETANRLRCRANQSTVAQTLNR